MALYFFNQSEGFTFVDPNAPSGEVTGVDAENGVPWSSCGDTYLLPHDVTDYALAAIEPTVISVYNLSGELLTTYDFSTASRTSIGSTLVGDQSGGGSVIIPTGARFEGTAPFALRTNISQREYHSMGYNSTSLSTLDSDKVAYGNYTALTNPLCAIL